ncbi:MAG: hypothetical protein IT220_11005 [Flavobacteriaceae bacterium]|nr:hypothetical protein [Flavobacteriaceae bacterium]
MKKTLIILIQLCYIVTYSQIENDKIGRVFISYFYQENIMTLNKSYVLTQIDSIEVNYDLIATYDFYTLKFYRFSLGKNKIGFKSNSNTKIIFNSSSCNDYVIAFDYERQIGYRLKGFNGNDLLFLLRDVNKKSYKKESLKKTLSKFKSISNEIDLECIYKSLTKLDFESDCLKECQNPLPAHGTIQE